MRFWSSWISIGVVVPIVLTGCVAGPSRPGGRDILGEGHDACEWLFDAMWADVGTRELVQFPPVADVEASMGGFVYLETGTADVRDQPGGPRRAVTYDCDLLVFFQPGDVVYRSLAVDGEVVYEIVIEDGRITNYPAGASPPRWVADPG